MKNLFLDDVRKEPQGWDVVRSYEAFVDYIEANGCPDVISFDHDLADAHYFQYLEWEKSGKEFDYNRPEEKTGYHCAKYLLEKNLIPSRVIVHSYNPVGARNIYNLFVGRTLVTIQPY